MAFREFVAVEQYFRVSVKQLKIYEGEVAFTVSYFLSKAVTLCFFLSF